MPRNRGNLSLDQRAALPVARDNPNLQYLRLDRREICLREINAAVRLLLIDEDPISAHLLASAATEIMVALSGGKSGVGLNDMRALMKTANVPSKKSDELFQSLLHPYNFLKHGSSDFSVENDFPVEHIIMAVYSAIHSYKVLFGNLSAEMKVFYAIVQCWRTYWWEGSPGFEEMQNIAEQMGLTGASYEEIYERGRELLYKTWEQTPP